MRGEKPGGKLKRDQTTHLWGWSIKPTKVSYKVKVRDNGNRVENVNVICQRKEKTQRNLATKKVYKAQK
jgi:hypothetical protein